MMFSSCGPFIGLECLLEAVSPSSASLQIPFMDESLETLWQSTTRLHFSSFSAPLAILSDFSTVSISTVLAAFFTNEPLFCVGNPDIISVSVSNAPSSSSMINNPSSESLLSSMLYLPFGSSEMPHEDASATPPVSRTFLLSSSSPNCTLFPLCESVTWALHVLFLLLLLDCSFSLILSAVYTKT